MFLSMEWLNTFFSSAFLLIHVIKYFIVYFPILCSSLFTYKFLQKVVLLVVLKLWFIWLTAPSNLFSMDSNLAILGKTQESVSNLSELLTKLQKTLSILRMYHPLY